MGHELAHIALDHDGFYRRRFLPVWGLVSAGILATAALSSPMIAAISFVWLGATLAAAAIMFGMYMPGNRRRELAADRLGAQITGVDAQLAALDAIAREHPPREHGRLLSALLRALDPYPTLAQRRAALDTLSEEIAVHGARRRHGADEPR